MIKNNSWKKGIFIIILFVILSQIVIILAAVQLTCFRDDSSKASLLNYLSLSTKNTSKSNPSKNVQVHHLLSGNETIEIWEQETKNSKGLVLLFHGYKGKKANIIDNANLFQLMGYSTILVDFRASGNSEGNYTTIGYLEAENVKTVYEFAQKKYDNITLYGISMGAASVMRAISLYHLSAQRIILECPFSTMEQTIRNRFERFHVPTFILVDLLTFWGGKIHGFDAFSHNPVDYAKDIQIPTLLMCGDSDSNVKIFETNNIFKALGTNEKYVHFFLQAGHENYIYRFGNEWFKTVEKFINTSTL